MSTIARFTKRDVIEILKSRPDHDGWIGIVCESCPFPNEEKLRTTANVDASEWEYVCPKCRFHTIIKNVKIYPIFLSPTHGISGTVIIEAYEELGYNVSKYLTDMQWYDIL